MKNQVRRLKALLRIMPGALFTSINLYDDSISIWSDMNKEMIQALFNNKFRHVATDEERGWLVFKRGCIEVTLD